MTWNTTSLHKPSHITNCNQLLQLCFPHCTIESIKGIRKGERYQQVLQTAKEKLDQEPSSEEPSVNNNLPPEQQPEVNSESISMPTTNLTSNQEDLTSNQEDPF